jgi:PQQ-like domain
MLRIARSCRRTVAGTVAVGLVGLSIAAAPSAGAARAPGSQPAAALQITETWSHSFAGQVAGSSPIPVRIDGATAVVVGTTGGKIEAVSLAKGKPVAGWPVSTPGNLPVESTPSVSPSGSTIFVGVGDAAKPSDGGYLALETSGKRRWWEQVSTLTASANKAGVQGGIAVGDLAGTESAVSGSLGVYADAFNTLTGKTDPGWPWYSSDSQFSTPAIANLYGNGKNYVIEGAQQTAGVAYGHSYKKGGELWVIDPTGHAGKSWPGSSNCDYAPNQGVQSSPAVGRILAGSKVGIVFGTGSEYSGASATDKVFAVSTHCQLSWTATLNGPTTSSPALVDALGNGKLQVAEGTQLSASNTGSVYLLNGATGAVQWHTALGGQVIGSITSANLGGGYQALLVPTTTGLVVLNGRTGARLARLAHNQIGLQNSALVTKDANGDVGITLAGYNSSGGIMVHYEVKDTDGGAVGAAGSWPMFHHDPQLTGTTLTRLG